MLGALASNLLGEKRLDLAILPVLGSIMAESAGTILIPEGHYYNR